MESLSGSSQRIFYQLLVRVGALGKYQYICLFIWGIMYMLSASTLFFNPFLFYQSPYICDGKGSSQCMKYVCSLPHQLRSQYLGESTPTFIDRFGDYRCDGKHTINMIETIIYFSGLIGIILSTYLNSFIRKKLLVQASLISSIISFIFLLVNKNLMLMVVFMCINYAAQTIIIDLSICFMTETVLEEQRGKHVMVLFIFLSIGCMLNGFFFNSFYWEMVFCCYFIVPIILVFGGLKWYIKQTPFDLVTNFSAEEAFEDFHWIAIQNGHHDKHQITVKQLSIIKCQYEESLLNNKQEQFTLLDLFRYESLRSDVIWCCVLHFFNYFSYCTPILALNQFSEDIYTNAIIFSSATLISSIFCFYLINDLERKKMINYTTIASLFFIIPLYITSSCTNNCSSNKWIETASIFVFRILLEIAYQAYNFIQNQLFPTQIRSIAILLTAAFSSLSNVFIPIVADFNERIHFFLPCSFILSGVIVIIAMSQIRQTAGVPPPEMIKELAFKHQEIYD